MAQIGLKLLPLGSNYRPNSSYFTRSCALHLHRPIKMIMSINTSTSKTHWATINDEIEAHLKRAIPIRDPLVVFEPMHHLTFDPPKPMAPALCVAACEFVGGHRAQALPAASAVQLMYATAYAHDHLPLADQPRPKIRVNHGPAQHMYGPNIELLTGDGLLPYAFELLAGHDNNNDLGEEHSGRVLRTIVELARSMGSQGMVDGQYKEVECGQLDIGNVSEEWLTYVYEKKEGTLHACAAACGAILGGGSELEIEKLRRFGLHVGVIQGMLHEIGMKDHMEAIELVKSLRCLALKELEGFHAKKVEAICTFLDLSKF